jgi:endonuclease III
MVQPLKDELMVQQQLPAHPNDVRARMWQHMVAVIMLNQTGRKAVKYVLPIFLDRWYDAVAFSWAEEEQVKDVIWPLGMVNVRYHRLNRMTNDFFSWNGHNATKLYGIGKYGSDSYEIFFKQNYAVQPTDKELKRYLEEEIWTSSISIMNN